MSEEQKPWQTLAAIIDEYVEDYEFRGDECGDYMPTDTERMLITDAIHGLLSEPEIVQAIRAALAPAESNTGVVVNENGFVTKLHLLADAPAEPGEGEYKDCSGDPSCCPENEGYGCCKPDPQARTAAQKAHDVGHMLSSQTLLCLQRLQSRIADIEREAQRYGDMAESSRRDKAALEQQLAEARERELRAHRLASNLAMALWAQHYKKDSPKFELCDSVAGILTQIDNMTAGLSGRLSVSEGEAKLAGPKALRDFIQRIPDDAKHLYAIDVAQALERSAARLGSGTQGEE